MAYLRRTLEKVIPQLSGSSKGILLSGMRQTGKTELMKHFGSDRPYVTLAEHEIRDNAMHAPDQLIADCPPHAIIDEIEWAPALFPALETFLDSRDDSGLFWLSGSQRPAPGGGIADTLVGRIALLNLLPLSIYERESKGLEQQPYLPDFSLKQKLEARSPLETWKIVFQGGFPEAQSLSGDDRKIFFDKLIDNVIEKDVPQLNSIEKRLAFRHFLRTLAVRSGQVLNCTALAQACGLTIRTTRTWLAIAEASGFIFMLPPFFENIGKRLVKSPKLYFIDTGLLCRLMGIRTPKEAAAHYNAGVIFETFVVMEIVKSWLHNGLTPDFYFYRDSDQNEIDLLIRCQNRFFPVEIKAAETPRISMLKSIRSFRKIKSGCGTAALISLVPEPVPLDANAVSHNIWAI
ncbi:DUF4143 domain-containing protein [uncultured Sutterella sp.]|uniref:ATP-binding protein n=1 Tax=uncultured Sutterella sp. TaxID=286133 RepID=UPI00260B210E|nr:DUF4143 domain-containing protein [uncultured Sutterella sp.]